MSDWSKLDENLNNWRAQAESNGDAELARLLARVTKEAVLDDRSRRIPPLVLVAHRDSCSSDHFGQALTQAADQLGRLLAGHQRGAVVWAPKGARFEVLPLAAVDAPGTAEGGRKLEVRVVEPEAPAEPVAGEEAVLILTDPAGQAQTVTLPSGPAVTEKQIREATPPWFAEAQRTGVAEVGRAVIAEIYAKPAGNGPVTPPAQAVPAPPALLCAFCNDVRRVEVTGLGQLMPCPKCSHVCRDPHPDGSGWRCHQPSNHGIEHTDGLGRKWPRSAAAAR